MTTIAGSAGKMFYLNIFGPITTVRLQVVPEESWGDNKVNDVLVIGLKMCE